MGHFGIRLYPHNPVCIDRNEAFWLYRMCYMYGNIGRTSIAQTSIQNNILNVSMVRIGRLIEYGLQHYSLYCV